VIDRVIQNKDVTFGYNALTDEYINLVEAGVIDPVKVVRCALENAASVASLMLTTETMIAEAPKAEKAGGGMPGGDMGGMGGGMPMM
jgi:chaperonin GroEL